MPEIPQLLSAGIQTQPLRPARHPQTETNEAWCTKDSHPERLTREGTAENHMHHVDATAWE